MLCTMQYIKESRCIAEDKVLKIECVTNVPKHNMKVSQSGSLDAPENFQSNRTIDIESLQKMDVGDEWNCKYESFYHSTTSNRTFFRRINMNETKSCCNRNKSKHCCDFKVMHRKLDYNKHSISSRHNHSFEFRKPFMQLLGLSRLQYGL